MSKLDPEQIERIVNGQEPAPQSHRNLTKERQLAYASRSLAEATSKIEPWETVEIDQPRRDKHGNFVMRDGLPEIDRVRVSKRAVVSKPFIEQLEQLKASYRTLLSKSNEDRATEDYELQCAIEREFGKPNDRAGLHVEVAAFARDWRAKRAAGGR